MRCALAAFSIATLFEVAAYYIPWVDNLLDTIAVPAATVAGTIVMASAVSEMSPFLKWGLAVIVGGGVAGTIQGFTSITRIASTATTGGLGNPVVSTVEAGGSVVMSILAITHYMGGGILNSVTVSIVKCNVADFPCRLLYSVQRYNQMTE